MQGGMEGVKWLKSDNYFSLHCLIPGSTESFWKNSHVNVLHQGATALVASGALLGHAGHGGVVAAEVNRSIFANWLWVTLAVALRKCQL